MHQLLAVKTENWARLLFVHFEPMPDDVKVGVVQTVFLESATLESVNERIKIGAVQVKDCLHIQQAVEHLSLMQIAGDAVQHEDIGLRMETSSALGVLDKIPPQLHGRLIGHELAATGVFDEHFGQRIRRAQGAEDIATRAVKEMRDGAENLALGAFACAGRAEEEDGFVFHALVG